jgi:hypothetical protein
LNLRNPNVRWEFTDDSLVTRVDDLERRTNWSDVQRVLKDEDFWMFAIKNGPHLFLPIDRLPEETKTFILARTAGVEAEIPTAAPKARELSGVTGDGA